MAQTTYNTTRRAPVAGMPQGDGVDVHVFNPTENMEGGIGVALEESATAANARQVLKPAAETDGIYGVTLWQHNIDNTDLTGDLIWPMDTPVPVRRQGRVWCYFEEACDPTDTVYMRHTATGAEIAGAFRTDADGTDADVVSGMRIIQGNGGAAGPALCELDFPVTVP